MSKQRLRKMAGYVAAFSVFIGGIMLVTFFFPLVVRPWIFLASILWIVVFSSGVLSS